jgi:hypothetical protein
MAGERLQMSLRVSLTLALLLSVANDAREGPHARFNIYQRPVEYFTATSTLASVYLYLRNKLACWVY